MEKAEKKPRINVWLVALALLLVIGLAVGIYFLVGSGRNKEPSRGTYVLVLHDGVKCP